MDTFSILAITASGLSVIAWLYLVKLALEVRALRSNADLSVHRGSDLLEKTAEIRHQLQDVPLRISDCERDQKSLRTEWEEHRSIIDRQMRRMNKWNQEDSGTAKGGGLSQGVLDKVREAFTKAAEIPTNGQPQPMTEAQIRARILNGG